jgi:hypothetical protein
MKPSPRSAVADRDASKDEWPLPTEGVSVTHLLIVRDVRRARQFVADIFDVYEQWRARGAEFLTPPKEHPPEIRCYLRDPDGYLIEVGQTKQEGRPT